MVLDGTVGDWALITVTLIMIMITFVHISHSYVVWCFDVCVRYFQCGIVVLCVSSCGGALDLVCHVHEVPLFPWSAVVWSCRLCLWLLCVTVVEHNIGLMRNTCWSYPYVTLILMVDLCSHGDDQAQPSQIVIQPLHDGQYCHMLCIIWE